MVYENYHIIPSLVFRLFICGLGVGAVPGGILCPLGSPGGGGRLGPGGPMLPGRYGRPMGPPGTRPRAAGCGTGR